MKTLAIFFAKMFVVNFVRFSNGDKIRMIDIS